MSSGGSDAEEDDDAGTMDLDGAEAEEEELDELARAKAVAKALAKGTSKVDDVADELQELNMDAYDDEEEGARLSSLYSSSYILFVRSDQVWTVFELRWILNCEVVIMSGIEIFSSGIGDLFYPSNDMDPYLKNNDVIVLSPL